VLEKSVDRIESAKVLGRFVVKRESVGGAESAKG